MSINLHPTLNFGLLLSEYEFQFGLVASALADRFHKGLQIIRKAGKMPVTCSNVKYTDYQLLQKELEIRQNPFPVGKSFLTGSN